MLIGHVEHYSQDAVFGWALDTDRPSKPEFVDVFFDGHLMARLAACLPDRSAGTSCSFKLLLPKELWFAHRRPLIEVRFARTGELLRNTPRFVSFNGPSKRVLVMIPAGIRYGHDNVKARPAAPHEHIQTYTNTGDWMVFDSSLKLLSFCEMDAVNVFTYTDADIDRFNSEYDYAFLRGSNYIHAKMDWRTADNLLSKLKIPIIAFSVGAQVPHHGKVNLPEHSVRVWKLFADHCASIGVRGTYSAEVLNEIGIKNIDVIGCPSLFRRNNPALRIWPKSFSDLRRIAFSLRREVSNDYSDDIARYLGVQKQFIKMLASEFDLTLTTHGEPAEKAFFYKALPLLQKYDTQLSNSGWFDADDNIMKSIYEHNLFYNDRVEDYDRFIQSQDLAMGFRVHGNLPAIANGVPALFVDYDSRSRELAETFRIPCLTLDDLAKRPLQELYRPELWDEFNENYPFAYQRMAAFLDKNGVAHNMMMH